MLKFNYSKTNINILSFFISLIIFLIIIYFLKVLSLKINPDFSNTPTEIQNIVNDAIEADINLDDVKEWKIKIEKLSLSAEIKEGTDESIIKENVGHFTTSNLLYGNIALKAYNTGENKKHFANLKELEIGDEIQYIINDKKVIYKVIQNSIVDEEEKYTQKIDKKQNEKDRITLITYIKDMNNKRRCVIAEKF